ncbi:MAG TPA: hypothetical protein DEQ80_01205 [Anaerolinea thermolimosa]|uniref:Uncharacterized protein n=1 Tax=Anaerolinea thermolimosa TaxID=229919 RepID=A0A3D1JD81_9CHLR|nr:hypothetical protein [Anaerolinea thermolimosa]
MSFPVSHRWRLVCGLLLFALASMGCRLGLPLVRALARRTEVPPVQLEVEVFADRPWTDTGVSVHPGDHLSIEYESGFWSPWPQGAYDALGFGGDPRCDCNVLAGASHAALIGRIDRGRPFLVGNDFAQPVGQAGRLYLGINDTRLEDNAGSLTVRIRITR